MKSSKTLEPLNRPTLAAHTLCWYLLVFFFSPQKRICYKLSLIIFHCPISSDHILHHLVHVELCSWMKQSNNIQSNIYDLMFCVLSWTSASQIILGLDVPIFTLRVDQSNYDLSTSVFHSYWKYARKDKVFVARTWCTSSHTRGTFSGMMESFNVKGASWCSLERLPAHIDRWVSVHGDWLCFGARWMSLDVFKKKVNTVQGQQDGPFKRQFSQSDAEKLGRVIFKCASVKNEI